MTEVDSTFIDHLASFATRTPDAPAISFRGQSMSWATLDDRARRHAAAQRAAGLTAGDRIGYLGKNHRACLEAVYGARYAATVCTVVNWRLAPAEITYVIKDAEIKLLFVSKEFQSVVDGIRNELPALTTVVVVDDDGPTGYEAWLSAAEPLQDVTQPKLSDPWIQLYTSGTTGFPKGAVLSYESQKTHADALRETFGLSTESVNMVPMPLYHVGGISWFLVGASLGGNSVVIEEMTPSGLLDDIAKYRVTHAFIVPAVIAMLLQVPDFKERDLSSLKYVLYGASPIPLPLLRSALASFTCEFGQVYGMTEMAGVITILDPESHRDESVVHRLTSAGRAIPSAEIRVVDPTTREEVPTGTKGEIIVRSRQRMIGYYGKPEATEAAFDGQWYRSGDVGHFDEDGYLYVSDRIKDMVISGGENVYPAEVERVLVEHPKVREAAVIGVPSSKWGETVKGVVALEPDSTISEAEVIAYCREQLAGYKCPTSIDFLEALPRNATGKVLKKDLRAPYWKDQNRQVS